MNLHKSTQFAFPEVRDKDIVEYVDDHATTLSFPEKLMLLLTHLDREFGNQSSGPIGWACDGKALVIRDPDMLVQHWLPRFHLGRVSSGKFASFLRKCYRWGFRKLSKHADPRAQATFVETSGIAQHQPTPYIEEGRCVRATSRTERHVYIACELFQRDKRHLVYLMESTTTVKSKQLTAAKFMQHDEVGKSQTSRRATQPLNILNTASLSILRSVGSSSSSDVRRVACTPINSGMTAPYPVESKEDAVLRPTMTLPLLDASCAAHRLLQRTESGEHRVVVFSPQQIANLQSADNRLAYCYLLAVARNMLTDSKVR